MRARTRTFLAACLVASTAAACSGRDAITIYSGRDEPLVGPILERFNEETGIAIDVRYGDSADLALLIAEEGEGTPADVFFSQTPGAVDFLEEQDLLGSLPDDVLGRVDPGFESEEGHWIGTTARQRVLVYNEDMVSESELPESVLELTDERYRGQVGLAPPNGSFQDFVTALRLEVGDEGAREWLEGMAANESPTYPDNLSIVDAVARGEIPMGLVNHYYNYRYLDENPDAPSRNYVFPNGDIGALLIASTISVLEPAEDDDQAQELVEFLLDEEAQQFFADETFEYPLIDGVEPSEELPPLESIEAPEIDLDRLGDLATTVTMIAESGLE
jgi:iron(III) transport system substrate-binding protein